ncbi:hypothetical protein [Biostraticola tofi]|uniref:hypothetical protein n=1 Tax=Biostraticola tofi TaxID=466109 RepID=UPI001E4CCC95|nr:hypothetical protein [Biostraticola tofi]
MALTWGYLQNYKVSGNIFIHNDSSWLNSLMKLTAALILGFAFSLSAQAAVYKLHIPTDIKAEYTVLEKGGKGNFKAIVTKRVGPSGTSFSKRLYDCSNHTVKYLGEGDTFEEMQSSSPHSDMAPIFDESIADYVGREACK